MRGLRRRRAPPPASLVKNLLLFEARLHQREDEALLAQRRWLHQCDGHPCRLGGDGRRAAHPLPQTLSGLVGRSSPTTLLSVTTLTTCQAWCLSAGRRVLVGRVDKEKTGRGLFPHPPDVETACPLHTPLGPVPSLPPNWRRSPMPTTQPRPSLSLFTPRVPATYPGHPTLSRPFPQMLLLRL